MALVCASNTLRRRTEGVPEIDPNSAAGALSLLGMGLAMLWADAVVGRSPDPVACRPLTIRRASQGLSTGPRRLFLGGSEQVRKGSTNQRLRANWHGVTRNPGRVEPTVY